MANRYDVLHDEDGNPVLLHSAKDLAPSEAKALVAIEQLQEFGTSTFDLRYVEALFLLRKLG